MRIEIEIKIQMKQREEKREIRENKKNTIPPKWRVNIPTLLVVEKIQSRNFMLFFFFEK